MATRREIRYLGLHKRVRVSVLGSVCTSIAYYFDVVFYWLFRLCIRVCMLYYARGRIMIIYVCILYYDST